MNDVWYRYEDRLYAAPLNEFDQLCGPGRVDVVCNTYPVLKYTPKGAWLNLGFGDKRFVLREARKRFACPTKAEAKESFKARKRRLISIYQARIRSAQEAMQLVENTEELREIPRSVQLV